MKKRTLPAKITRPATASAYRRTRLLRLLDEGRKTKAVWVCGPPGAGKTTLVSSYMESRKLPCLWYQVDPGDRDPATFFHYLGMGAANISSGRITLPHFTQEYSKNLPEFARNFFRELFRRVNTPSAIVFDNFQEVSPAASGFHEMILEALREVPHGCSVVLITRGDPPKLFARNLANREMKLIGWHDLRLTGAEAKEISRFWGYKLSSRECRSLAEKAEGWTAGLLLMIEGAQKGFPGKGDGGVTAVFDYFMAEIFEKADPLTRDLLLRTAFLPDMTAYMATQLSGNIEASSLLAELSGRQFFVARKAEKEAVYQFHPLFREFLLARARETFAPRELAAVMRRSARLLLESGYVEDAAGLFIEAGDVKGLTGLILDHASDLLSQGRAGMLESWIGAVPGDQLRKSPWLLYYRGLCRLPVSPGEARKSLEAAHELLKGSARGAFLSWSALIDTYMYEWRDFRPLDRLIREFDRHMGKYGAFPDEESEYRATTSIFGALMFRQPFGGKMRRWEERVRKIMEVTRDPARKIAIGRNLILYHLWTGDIARAGMVVSELRGPFRSSGRLGLAHLMWLRSSALYNSYAANFGEALAMVDEGLRLAEKTGIHLLDVMFLGQGVYNSLAGWDLGRAESYFSRIRPGLSEEACYENIYFHHQASIVCLHRGDLPASIEHAREAFRLTERSGAPLLLVPAHYVLVYAMIESGDLRGIERELGVFRGRCRMIGSAFHEAVCLALEALTALRKGEEEKGMGRLAKALSIRSSARMFFMPFFLRSTLTELFGRALERGVEAGCVKELIREYGLAPASSAAAPPEWPYPVKIYTLGGFEIYRDAALLGFERKAQQKVLDLLKAIISLGGKDVSDNELIDALWPDSEGDAGCRALATTLHRLRKLIGPDSVRYSEGRITLNDRWIWLDAWHFDELLAKADALKEKGDNEGFSRSVEKALKLCRGPYLGRTTGPPCVTLRRERIKAKFIRYLVRLAESIEKAGLYEEAADLYARGIEADGLNEKLFRKLIACHSKAGNRTEAVKSYKRCEAALSSALGIAPSPETEAAYREALSK